MQKWTRTTRETAPRETHGPVLFNVATDVRPAAVWERISETGLGDALITCNHGASINGGRYLITASSSSWDHEGGKEP